MESLTPEQHYKLSVLLFHIQEELIRNTRLHSMVQAIIEKFEKDNNITFEGF